MSILEYMNASGMRFWRSTPVSLLLSVGEWCVLLFFVHRYGEGLFAGRRRLSLHVGMLAFFLFLQFRHFQVALHCLTLLVACAAYICLLTGCNWFSGVFEGSLFCLMLELGKSLCRDGLLAYGLSRALALDGTALNLMLCGLYMAYLMLLCRVFARRRRQILNLPITMTQTMGLLFPFFLYLAIRLLQYGQVDRLDNVQWFQYDLLQYAVAVCALLVMGATESMLTSQLELNELTHRQLLMDERQRQYEMQRETMAFINHRWHDMKHYITGIELILEGANSDRKADIEEAEKLIGGLKRGIDLYGDMHRTGSDVMDVLLFQKTQECRQKGLRLIPYIDASRAGFISTLDMSALFGNAMDNAIEAVEALEAPELKEIRVKIGVSDRMLLLRFENRCRGPRRVDRGRFLTTKADAQGHGYGLSTIAAIAEKYGGTAAAESEEDTFTLHILIPLPEQEGETL